MKPIDPVTRRRVEQAIARYRNWQTASPSRLATFLREQAGAAGDVKVQYGASAALTLTLASLATSSSRTTGRESTAVATTGTVVDYLVGGKITTGTTPTVDKQIDVWVYAAVEDDPIYPDVFDGTDSAETVTSENVRNGALRLATSIRIDGTSDRTYWIAPFSVAQLFGGHLPTHWGVFVAHDTAVNLNATGGNHAIYYTPVYYNVASS
jgi:hypothetical protein